MSVDVVVAVLTVETCPEGGKDAKLTLFIDTRKKKEGKKIYTYIYIRSVSVSSTWWTCRPFSYLDTDTR